jgi:hypothetical protein
VPKKKNGTALFEALSRSKDKVGLPARTGGWAGKSSQSPAPSSGQAGDSSPAGVHGPAPLGGATYGRAPFALSGAGVVVLAAVLVAAVVAAFVVGRMTGRGGGNAVVNNGASQPVTPERPSGLTQQYSGGSVGDLPTRVPGKYYLVIQTAAGMSDQDKKDASQIAGWLWHEKKEPAEVRPIRISSDKIVYGVWSLRPFESYLGADAIEFGRNIEELGKEYKLKYGKYWFSQHRQGKLDPYYIQDKNPPRP